MTAAKDLQRLDGQQTGEDIGEIAQHHEQHVRTPGPCPAGGVLNLLDVAGVGPARIGLMVGKQRHPQVNAQRGQRDQRTFLEAGMQLLTPDRRLLGCGGFLQNAGFPARLALDGVERKCRYCTALPACCQTAGTSKRRMAALPLCPTLGVAYPPSCSARLQLEHAFSFVTKAYEVFL